MKKLFILVLCFFASTVELANVENEVDQKALLQLLQSIRQGDLDNL